MDEHQRLANRFRQDLVETIRTLSREIAYRAPRFAQMLNEHGGVRTAQLLLQGHGTS